MKKIFAFLLLSSGIFLNSSSSHAMNELQFDMEIGQPACVAKTEIPDNKMDTFINKFHEFYDFFESNIYYLNDQSKVYCLKSLKEEVAIDQWVDNYFQQIAQVPGIGVTCFPNYYAILRDLIRCSAQAIIKSEEYSSENIELFTLVEKLDPVWHYMDRMATEKK